jgi:metal transporter CNNM
MSLISWCPGGLVDVDKWNAQLCDSFTVTAGPVDGSHTSAPSSEALTDDHVIEPQPYQGFPPELLDLPSSRKENHFLNHPASTLPRMNGPVVDIDILAVKHDGRSKSREDSFQHDRALLPTQRKFIDNSGNMTMSGARSSSFWF